MIFCEMCFTEYSEIQDIIRTLNEKGDCPTCKSRSVHICNSEYLSADSSYEKRETLEGIKNIFNEMVSIYSLKEDLPEDFPKGELESVKESLFYKWNIFNKEKITPAHVRDILIALLPEKYESVPGLFDELVGIKERSPSMYKQDLLILKDNNWEDFTHSIKYENRFHSQQINLANLEFFLSYFEETVSEGEEFYRCRLNNDEKIFEEKDLKAPPEGVASAGRLNPEGISRLYLCSEEETAIGEIRASRHDIVTIGKFQVKEKLRVLDLSNFDQINILSTFGYSEFLKYYLNMDALKQISDELAKPVRSSDKSRDYLATQYISDFVKSITGEEKSSYQGIKYRSTASETGYNLMLFKDSEIELVSQETKAIKYIKYLYGKGTK
ncbi:RES family NAD+ phosphorylase [Enterococcus hulanensis]|uniref:RES family NAD+ phosphorylase n=1 Tax=Enterococcus hulanensis TaxID=2559929 RepID=A0ABU3EZH9_9ENTE|nr:RES family NAD+ phosphorylase [Enterococcus hulanensis]MDT2600282.1 RES family NAD+ phosphorylase [Enterococcus hulanensis]MDT2609095.1 RES family NAD+ phosphorylase [Enterococcus hulanensis]MDT2616863.1 RES family NAD+ phosphorylase [Enterococcus hulanensis]MDT2628617.1 RES family NAD+ phosphorylase [Enterococcus hulanensis]MDT2655957.1 RES family NAD+ phosphorylase [Enterococcus hulanensis]